MNAVSDYDSNNKNKTYFRRLSRYRREDKIYYDWERDFPVSLHKNKGKKDTIFKLKFKFTEIEVKNFRKEIKSSLNGEMELEIKIAKGNSPNIKVLKGGIGGKILNTKSDKITEYISNRISFNYIPTIRTHKQAIEIIDNLLSEKLSLLEDNDNYKKALKTIKDLQIPVLKDLSNDIKLPLSEFLPSINNVEIKINEERRVYRRNFEVLINDGTLTSLEYKGDGVKSLATLGLLKNKNNFVGASIIAIEEPESHLHPGAIHQLKQIINSLEENNQVVLTTHNPLFVNRKTIKSNIIVDKGKAVPAKSINSIRKILGVRVSDNLTNARFVLVVEGEADKVALFSILSALSSKLNLLLKNNQIIIDFIRGASKLSQKLSTLESQMCLYHVFLDTDEEANRSIEKVKSENLLNIKNLTQVNCPGMKESEFEDLLNVDIYKDKIKENYGVDLDVHDFKNSKNKWSKRIKEIFYKNGKSIKEEEEKEIKILVAKAVKENPLNAISEHKKSSIESLISSLEEMVSTKNAVDNLS